jgi:toxin ParE1/3/4
MTRTVVFSAQAEHQLGALYRYIEEYSSTARAESFVGGIVAYCHAFEPFPERGTRRDDIRPGLRVLGYRRRVSIAHGRSGHHRHPRRLLRRAGL